MTYINSISLLYVAIGGASGAVSRYVLVYWINNVTCSNYWGTLGVNILGSFAAGIVLGSTLKNGSALHLLLVTGFLGGFTTFSAFSLDLVQILQSRNFNLFAFYFLTHMLIPVLFAFLGSKITHI